MKRAISNRCRGCGEMRIMKRNNKVFIRSCKIIETQLVVFKEVQISIDSNRQP